MILPLELQDHSSILVAGAGGGFDVVCALPVALALRRQGHRVHLASYSFTDLDAHPGLEKPRSALPRLFRVTAQPGPEAVNQYYPEMRLCQWFGQHLQEEREVWSYSRVGVAPLAEIFEYLAERLELDTVVVVDAGVDGLFIGNEHELATPSIDAISILAAYQTRLRGYYAFTAFGTEGVGQEVRHADALRRISELIRRQGMLGVSALTPSCPEGCDFRSAVAYIHSQMEPWRRSVMASSLLSALNGGFGDTDLTPKTSNSPVWISPLTLLYWFFELTEVAEAKPYLSQVLHSQEVKDVADSIAQVRQDLGVLPRSDIPI